LLSNSEWEERINLEETSDKMNLIEELQWKKSGTNWILQGDANT